MSPHFNWSLSKIIEIPFTKPSFSFPGSMPMWRIRVLFIQKYKVREFIETEKCIVGELSPLQLVGGAS
jgi:hypothetical protein